MNIKSIFMAVLACFAYLTAVSFQSANPLQGVWEYQGGKYNKQLVTATKEVKLTKTYSNSGYLVLATGKAGKTVKNEEGTYAIKNSNSYIETQTYTNLTSKLKGKVMQYTYTIQNNKLTIKGRLTNNMSVEEYWKKIK